MGSGPRSTNPDAAGSGLEAVATTARPAFQAAQLLGRAIGAGLFAITPAGERGMCCKDAWQFMAGVLPATLRAVASQRSNPLPADLSYSGERSPTNNR